MDAGLLLSRHINCGLITELQNASSVISGESMPAGYRGVHNVLNTLVCAPVN
jgi:hypothetical protein